MPDFFLGPQINVFILSVWQIWLQDPVKISKIEQNVIIFISLAPLFCWEEGCTRVSQGVTPLKMKKQKQTMYVPTHSPVPTCASTYLITYVFVYLPTYLLTHVPTYMFKYPPTYLPTVRVGQGIR